MRRHRVPAKRGWRYGIPFVFVIAVGGLLGMVALEHEVLAWLMLAGLGFVVVPYLADWLGRLVCGIGSPRVEARALREALAEEVFRLRAAEDALRLVSKSRDNEVRRRLIADQHLRVTNRRLADLERGRCGGSTVVFPAADSDATVLLGRLADETQALPAVSADGLHVTCQRYAESDQANVRDRVCVFCAAKLTGVTG